ncbi:hypothetical protein GCM10009735_84970 [Actinomadura chokoriensis]
MRGPVTAIRAVSDLRSSMDSPAGRRCNGTEATRPLIATQVALRVFFRWICAGAPDMLVRMGPVSPVFAGRAAELAELRGAHARACTGEPAVLVGGEAGRCGCSSTC